MDNVLAKLSGLFNSKSFSLTDQNYVFDFIPTDNEKDLFVFLEAEHRIEQIVVNGKIVSATSLALGEMMHVEISIFQLEGYHVYENFSALVVAHGLDVPAEFYIVDQKLSFPATLLPNFILGYMSASLLGKCLTAQATFSSSEDEKILYLFHEKNAASVTLAISAETVIAGQPKKDEVEAYCGELNGNIERRKIYLKETIDFLNTYEERIRFEKFYMDFELLYEKCQTAYAFFLSDFSYSKLKLELESAILDYSKNIRSIINDSQTKLIAIPAAFLVASGQLSLDDVLSPKNFLILVSATVFSILIEIFIRNQESSLAIFIDNIQNYKTTFALRNHKMHQGENQKLQGVINSGFLAIDKELLNQRRRLNWIRFINWGMTLLILILLIVCFFQTETGQRQLRFFLGNV